MPFIAQKKRTGEAVKPSDITDKFHKKEELECPFCGKALTFREKATNKQGEELARAHFWHSKKGYEGEHSASGGGCAEGGESAEHEEKKMFVLELLEQGYRGKTFVEREIGDRVADCGIEFERQRGDERGVVVEVQFKNADKDYRAVTKNYLKHGFGVHWVFITAQTWDHLYDAKNALEAYPEEDFWLGKIDLPDYDLGDKLWFHNFAYDITDGSDLIGEDHRTAKVKIDIDWLDDSLNTYLVVERDSVDQSEVELMLLGNILRDRPSKTIADAKFD